MSDQISLPARQTYLLISALLAVAFIAWIASLRFANYMVPGMPSFIGLWTVMMAAMMLPSVLPAVLLFTTVARSRTESGLRPAPTAVFVIGYLGMWAFTGVAAAWLNQIGEAAMSMWRPMFVGGALII